MSFRFRSCSLEQEYLLPPSIQEWLPATHLARFIGEVVEGLDLKAILRHYERKDGRGAEAYHPTMLTRLLVYGYCVGVASSRRIERATYDDVAFRFLASDQHPDHDTIANFRRHHREALGELFVQVLALCREAGLVKAGTVALDGTKMAANANRRKTMSAEKLQEVESKLAKRVAELLEQAETTDAAEDAQYGKGNRGDDVPAELADRQTRLARIREAQQRLKAEAQARAAQAAREQQEQKKSGKPATEAQRKRYARARKRLQEGSINLTDPESKVMKDGNRGGYVQGYNAQAAVLDNQLIVAADVTNEEADKRQLAPMAVQIEASLGTPPTALLADTGYWSEEAITDPRVAGMELFVPPDRSRPDGELKRNAPRSETAKRMREKLRMDEGAAIYKLRQQTVEPVFGQIKEARGLRRFLMRGLNAAKAEWRLICAGHNLLKLYRHERRQALAGAV
jgi:transposase